MRLPPWAIEALRNGVADVARKASDAETLAKVKEQAKELFRELPENASKGLDTLVKTATETAKQAVDQGRDTLLRWNQRNTEIVTPCLNATGILLDARGHSLAISDHTMQLGCSLLRGDHVRSADNRNVRTQINDSLSKILDRDDNRVLVATNLDAAIASLTAITDQFPIAIHRSQAIRLPSGLPLPECFDGAAIVEFGGVQAMSPNDFAELDQSCIVLADNGQSPIAPFHLNSDHGPSSSSVTAAVLPIATLKQADLPSDEMESAIPSADATLNSGVDLVIFPGGPITGGPECGYIVGKPCLIESIEKSAKWNTLAAPDSIAGMAWAAATDSEPSELSKRISTNEDNLRNRAERMTVRLSAEDDIAACRVTESPALLTPEGRWCFPSRQLRIRHKSHSAIDWQRKLETQSPAIIAEVENDELIVDLRWIAASQDSQLAETIAPQSETSDAAEQ